MQQGKLSRAERCCRLAINSDELRFDAVQQQGFCSGVATISRVGTGIAAVLRANPSKQLNGVMTH